MAKIYAIVLAAGTSSRLGFSKLALKIDGETVIGKAVAPFFVEEVEKIFVVTNKDSRTVEKELEPLLTAYPELLTVVINPLYKEGMSSSVKVAFPYVKDAEAVFFHLGDKPFVSRENIKDMVRIYEREDKGIIVPVYKGAKGHPVMIRVHPYLEDLRDLSGDTGLREIIEKHLKDVLFIESEESSIFDIDTVDDVEELRRRGYSVEKG
jgi:molybdenum cofactor cytidylyltransferase